ncbi:MAG: cysteine hydrolase [Lachnospiraceae bacterium]|nr:cysteine hydrolase [Lachnospiraceae bacterium]
MKALLIIDMQEKYFKNQGYDRNLVFKVNKRIDEAIENKELIVYILNFGKRKIDLDSYEFVAGLKVVNEFILSKTSSDAFTNPNLTTLLKEKNVDEVEVGGIDGNVCVYKTALGAKKNGFKVVYNEDCVDTKSKKKSRGRRCNGYDS